MRLIILNMLKYLRFLTVFIGTLSIWNYSYGSDFQSPRTSALGGAGHAGPMLSDSIYLNPSFTSFMQTHSFSVNYLYYRDGHNLNVSVQDGTPDSLFQAGVGYTRRDDVSLIHIGASKSLWQRLGIGIGTKFILPNDESNQLINDVTFSSTGLLTRWLQTALVIDNLIQAAPQRGFYREYTLGTKINVDSVFLIYADPHWAPDVPSGEKAFGFEGGLEFPFFSDFFLRLGTFQASAIPFLAQRGDGYGIGVGWMGPRISFDYGFTRVVIPGTYIAHNIGLTVYF